MQFGGVRLGNSDTGGKLQDFSSAEAWVSDFQYVKGSHST